MERSASEHSKRSLARSKAKARKRNEKEKPSCKF